MDRDIKDQDNAFLWSQEEPGVPISGGHGRLWKTYRIGGQLGSGQFGEVYRALDSASGKLVALKFLKPPTGSSEERRRFYSALKREVENLSTTNHPHIVDYIATVGCDCPRPTIIMGLKDGTLTTLIASRCSTPITDLGVLVFHHMLQALDYLAAKGIVHRDVKPDNILYMFSLNSKYHFQLGDFGLSNYTSMAATFVGSPLFMAPEMFQTREQTHKLDIWSLYVTMLWTLDAHGFREKSKQLKGMQEIQAAVVDIASSEGIVSKISEMGRVNPEKRASAAQMLVKCFNGAGLSTPRAMVSPIAADLPRVHGRDLLADHAFSSFASLRNALRRGRE